MSNYTKEFKLEAIRLLESKKTPILCWRNTLA